MSADAKPSPKQVERACRARLGDDAADAAAWIGLASALNAQRRHREAADAAAMGARLAPELTAGYVQRGVAMLGLGRPADAVTALAQAVKRDPADARALCGLADALAAHGRVEDAATYYRHAILADPDYAPPQINLGALLRRAGRLDDAIERLASAAELAADEPAAHVNLGAALADAGQNEQALRAFDAALALAPDLAVALSGRGAVLHRLWRLAEARDAFARATAADPNLAAAWSNLGGLLNDMALHDEARAAMERALALAPNDPATVSNAAYASLYDPSLDVMAIVTRHFAAGDAIAHEAEPAPAFAVARDPDRRLRVGYVSPDFRAHPIGFFLADVLPAHDRAQVEVVAFSDAARPDAMTKRLQAGCDHWRDTAGLSDGDLLAVARGCAIDVLVDLTGHMQANRLSVFAQGAAPVQASWAGYPGTTGLARMDAVLLDAHLAADPECHAHYRERALAALPVYACYAAPDYAPEVGPPPALANGFVTFGAFNNLAKVNAGCIAAWAAVMKATPGSLMVLKTHALGDADTAARIRALFAQHGVAGARLTLEGAAPHEALLARYGDIDIVLDTFPYTGSTSMMEGLWMGAPAVSLSGRLYHQRHGGAVLAAAGLGDLVADGVDDYIGAAVDLARDIQRLAELRAGMRARLAASPLRDGAAMARALEAAYRGLWRDWLARDAGERT